MLRLDGKTETLFERSRVQLPGPHLAGDLLAAAVAARLLGAPVAAIARAAYAFRGVEHVLELVAEVRGVRFFNDSKATNIDAARKSLLAFDGPVLAILGGRYKGGRLRAISPTWPPDGARWSSPSARPRSASKRASPPSCRSSAAPPWRRPWREASPPRAPGDTVVLAPACSSFDMFKDYADRGRAFKDAVRRLAARERG